MLRILALLILLPISVSAQTELRKLDAEIAAPFQAVLALIRSQDMPDVVEKQVGRSTIFAYAGTDTPAPLVGLVSEAFPDLDLSAFGPDTAMSLTLSFTDAAPNTMISLVAMGQFQQGSKPRIAAPGSTVLMGDADPEACQGQLVLTHPTPLSEASEIYASRLMEFGFAPDLKRSQDVSFFFGQAPGCSAMLYFNSDGDTLDQTTIVIRFLEE